MESKRRIQNLTIIVLGIAMIIMSIGYAAYSTTLEINGDTTMKAANWDIHFANIADVVTPTSDGSSATASISSNNLKVEFDTVLNVGEKYQFKVDVVNNGTFDAILNSITGTGYFVEYDNDASDWSTSTTPIGVTYGTGGQLYKNDYVKYTLTYDDDSVLTAGESGDQLTKKGTSTDTKTLLVTVEYFQPDDASKLPSVDTKYHFELDLKYVQK